ncbi:uncharacterized protein LOC119077264, partial [Bradysia coprophila]|uniref:uncharacterized protein LOC119077264 n=1 Tax=Bradysia coprophila TaxID=38358 RepID=UPI00187D93B3
EDGVWKPFQRGFLVSCTSILELSSYLLTERGFEYFLPSRGLQDCLENLFSCVRSDNPKPNAIQVRDAIKNIAISEYLSAPVANASYQWDESTFLNGFLNVVRAVREQNQIATKNMLRGHSQITHAADENDKTELKSDTFDLNISKVIVSRREQNVLYKISCYILYKVASSTKKMHCDTCLSYCRAVHVDESLPYTSLMRQPNFKYHSQNYIHHLTNVVFMYFLHMEKVFRLVHPILSGKKKNNLGYLIRDYILDSGFKCDIPNCHSLQKTLTTRFVEFRLKNSGKDRLKKRNFDFSSHTMN